METIGFDRKVTKRPNKKMVERLKSAQDRLSLGQSYRQKRRESSWRESVEQYEGTSAWRLNPDDKTADLVSVNISFSTINTLLPFVADEDPAFVIEPYSGDATAENATLLQSFLNRLWRSSDVQGTRHMRDAIFDYLLYGDGYVKVGYAIDEKPIFTHDGEKVENEVDVASFFVERINPWDIWIDPYSDGIPNARWVCQRILYPKAQLLEDDRFFFSDDDSGDGVDDRNMSPEDEHRLDDTDEDWVTVFEFYDLRENYMVAFSGTQIVKFVEHIKCPIHQVANYRIANSPYHLGELEQIASLQEELNKTRSQMITHRRRNVAKWMVRGNLLTPEAMQAMQSSKVNDIIPIESNEPFNNIIAPVHATPLAADSYQIDDQIRNDINEVTGVNEYLRGVPQNISRTATEASIIEGATNIRTRHKLLQVETAARHVGQFLLDMIKDVLPLTDFNEMTQFVTGREAEKLNRATGADELQTDVLLSPVPELFVGKYEVSVERGSTELRNPEAKAAQLKDMVQMMLSATPLLMNLGVPFNIKRLMEMWFESEGIDDIDALFETDEEQAMRQQLDLQRQMLEAQGLGGAGGGTPAAGPIVGGTASGPGEPRPETTAAPQNIITDENSGILPPR